MNFGYNTKINKVVRKITERPKKQLQTERPTEHLESFDNTETTNEISKNTTDLSETPLPLGESDLNTIPSVWRSGLRSHKTINDQS